MPGESAQTPAALPQALTEHVGFLAVKLGFRAQRRFSEAMRTLDLRPADYDFLATVAERGPLPQKDIATILDLDAARVVALVDTLEERGYAFRTVDPRDRRRNLVDLTPAGREAFSSATQTAAEVEAELLAPLTESDRRQLRSLLQCVVELA